MIVNAGIRRVVYEQGYPDAFSLEIFAETGVVLEKYETGSEPAAAVPPSPAR